ncbi:MAG: hypothetical protein ACRES4_06570 [Nevskiales bacterium]
MLARPWHKLLLAAVLVFGQWLAIAHDYQHPALGDGEQNCQICLHGPNFQAGSAATPAIAKLSLSSEVPLARQTYPVLTRRYTQAAIRAPPTLLV